MEKSAHSTLNINGLTGDPNESSEMEGLVAHLAIHTNGEFGIGLRLEWNSEKLPRSEFYKNAECKAFTMTVGQAKVLRDYLVGVFDNRDLYFAEDESET